MAVNYFAYGSNMASHRLLARIPGATKISTATLPGHRLRFRKSDRGRSAKCDIEMTGNLLDRVHGVVYQFPNQDKQILDRYEGLGVGYNDKLVELEAYEPLLRAGWTQPTYEKELTGPIPLQSLAEPPSWLDGSLTLYLVRYLHLVVDLTMAADRTITEDPEDETVVELTFGDSRVQNDYDPIDVYGELLRPPIHYRIFEDQIVKNGDIRYYDHPKFGVIAKITRFEEPEEEEFIDDTDDLLPGGQLSP